MPEIGNFIQSLTTGGVLASSACSSHARRPPVAGVPARTNSPESSDRVRDSLLHEHFLEYREVPQVYVAV
jgi:hypothetical protein